jgi:hypothetical protein
MSDIAPILSTALIPLTSFISLSIYLTSHPSSPALRLFSKSGYIALPTHRDEGLDGALDELDKDPFDIEDPQVLEDGHEVEPEKFWASMWRRKVALILLLLLPFACNITLLVFTALQPLEQEAKTRALLQPILVIPSHLVTFLLAILYLGHSTTATHWPTTVHLASAITIQFLTLSFLALLPSDPLPRQAPMFLLAVFDQMDLFVLPPLTPLNILQPLLPILHLPPFLVMLFIRRGPPLHVDPRIIYPPKITNSIPPLDPILDPSKPNLTEEAEVTVAEWMLFSYATNVIKKGYTAETMDVWDLPVLMANMRRFPIPHLGLTTRGDDAVPHHPEDLWSYHETSGQGGRIQPSVEGRKGKLGTSSCS